MRNVWFCGITTYFKFGDLIRSSWIQFFRYPWQIEVDFQNSSPWSLHWFGRWFQSNKGSWFLSNQITESMLLSVVRPSKKRFYASADLKLIRRRTTMMKPLWWNRAGRLLMWPVCPTCQSCRAVVLSRSQASEESRVGLDPKPGTEGADGVEWLNKGWKKQKHEKLKL